MFSFYEFFAGGGMARLGLGPRWKCLFANDFDPRKGRSYRRHWGDDALVLGDVRGVSAAGLPGRADLVWASFPCQDLSLAGSGAGLNGQRSGTFWSFWRLMTQLASNGRHPELIVLENVPGTISSHGGSDFRAIVQAYNDLGYRVGAVVIDAVLFLPQSRPRLFVVGLRDAHDPGLRATAGPSSAWHPRGLRRAYGGLPVDAKDNWIWWDLMPPPARRASLRDVLEDDPVDVRWHTPSETNKLLGMMSSRNLDKVHRAQASGELCAGALYKRTRRDASGRRVQRAEVRFDGVAGCLRTPTGGSSRQFLLVVKGQRVRSRLISARETARLMGLPDDYALPDNYNEGYHLTGDGVVVPAVRHLAEQVLEPVLESAGDRPG